MRRTVFWAAGFALALAVGGCDLLQKAREAVSGGAGDTIVKDNPDDTAVLVSFSVDANGSRGKTTTSLALSFDKTVAGLTADNITLIDSGGTGIQKGALRQLDDAAQYYALAVSGIGGYGGVGVQVTAPAGYKFSVDGAQKEGRTAWVEAPKRAARFTVEASGGIPGWRATKGLLLPFSTPYSAELDGLTAENITLIDTGGTGIQKGRWYPPSYNGSYVTYALAVSGIIKAGTVTVKVAAPEGVFFAQDTYTMQVEYGTE